MVYLVWTKFVYPPSFILGSVSKKYFNFRCECDFDQFQYYGSDLLSSRSDITFTFH